MASILRIPPKKITRLSLEKLLSSIYKFPLVPIQ